MIRDIGALKIEDIGPGNVPVVCLMSNPEKDGDPWTWTATNFMPRRECCAKGWHLEADTKEEIILLVRERVLPLYEAAVANLKESGENYYFEHAKTGG